MHEFFEKRWRERFGLLGSNWKQAAKHHLKSLPFSSSEDTWPLVSDLFTVIPNFLAKRNDTETTLLAEAYAWCCFSFWQCGSHFPPFPENYALFLRDQLPKSKRSNEAILLARQLVDLNANGDRCGFNRLTVADAETIRASERLVVDGNYDFYLNAKAKYDEYVVYLRQSLEFQREWKALKAAFPGETNKRQILRRSLIPERNWVRGPGAQFHILGQRFQALFDVFCWKYFLWGMKADEPLLMKPSVVYTPLGTQIFIPGYLSLDAKRDLDFKAISELHRARGLPRQGPGFSAGRLSRIELAAKAKAADGIAREKGLKGDARYAFIVRSLQLTDRTDHRQIRKFLQRREAD